MKFFAHPPSRFVLWTCRAFAWLGLGITPTSVAREFEGPNFSGRDRLLLGMAGVRRSLSNISVSIGGSRLEKLSDWGLG